MEKSLIQEQFVRTRMLLGDVALERLRTARVAVFGVGGVGGYAVEVLARSGIGTLDLIDADRIELSNLNRQIIGLHSTLGRPKVEVAAERIRDINPQCRVTTFQQFYLPENAAEIDLSQYDYVLDCIDTVTAKVELARRCHGLGVPLLCCLGAANKMDTMAFRVSDITKTKMDPLAKVLRRKLRELGIPHLKCVWSEEQPLRPILLESEVNRASELLVDHTADSQTPSPVVRRTVPASNAFVPAVAGLIAGGEVIKDLIS